MMMQPEHLAPSTLGPSHNGASIGQDISIRGEVTGSESLYIAGKVEGTINLRGSTVTVGPSGQVSANIFAKEIIVIGLVVGDCDASDRVEVRGSGSLFGKVITSRIAIESGASLKGAIDIRHEVAVEGSSLADAYDARAEESIKLGRFQTVQEISELDDILPKWRSPQRAVERAEAAVRVR
jgi:cytoskeletal protein CcmA (bactofilin family)